MAKYLADLDSGFSRGLEYKAQLFNRWNRGFVESLKFIIDIAFSLRLFLCLRVMNVIERNIWIICMQWLLVYRELFDGSSGEIKFILHLIIVFSNILLCFMLLNELEKV